MLGNKTGLSIEKFLESPFAGKHSKLISKGTKLWLLSSRLWAAAPSPWRALRRLNPGTPCASAGSHTSGSARRSPARSTARKS
jgi:hypothetical protein